MPADGDLAGIKSLLRSGKADGWWYFEEGCVTDTSKPDETEYTRSKACGSSSCHVCQPEASSGRSSDPAVTA